ERSDVFVAVSGAPMEYARATLRDAGVPLCSDPVTAIRVLGAIQKARTKRWNSASAPVGGARRTVPKELTSLARSGASAGVLSEPATKRIIEAYGIGVPARFAAATLSEAESVLATHPTTYVMKANASGVAHKTEAG